MDTKTYQTIKKIHEIMTKNSHIEDCPFYLFLDFDGVISVAKHFETEEEYTNAKEYPALLYKEYFDRLNSLCTQFPIEIIISSSWRSLGLEYCQSFLYEHGLNVSIPVIGITSILENSSREEEIMQYLVDHPFFKNFIILDDGSMDILSKHLIQTEYRNGLTEEKRHDACVLLRKMSMGVQ